LKRSKILILGASVYQVPLISLAKELGFYTYAISNIETDPGLEVADESYPVSILDCESIYKLISDNNIDAALTCASDLATLTLGKINDKFSFEGISHKQAYTVSNKAEFGKLQDLLKLPHPKKWIFSDSKSIKKDEINDTIFPLIIKPVLGSGSKGVVLINFQRELHDFLAGLDDYKIYENGVIIEKYLSGKDVSGECILQEGRVGFLEFTEKQTDHNLIPISHRVPYDVDRDAYNSIKLQINRICHYLKVENSIINLDVIIREKDEPVIIDFSFRPGGNHMYELMKLKYGIDVLRKLFEFSGLLPLESVKKACSQNSYTSCILGAEDEFVMTNEFVNNLKREWEERNLSISLFNLDYKSGDTVPKFTASNKRFGNVIFSERINKCQ